MAMKVTGSPSDRAKSGAAGSHPVSTHGVSGASGTSVRGTEGVGATFLEVVDDMESRQIIEELDAIGAEMTKFPTTALVRRYRELVGAALDKVRNGMQIRREFKWRRTERSMFITIEKTEGLLDDLETALLREGDRAKGLALTDEIKGCLISLLF